MNSTIKGYAMSPDELPWLHDVFMDIGEDFDQLENLLHTPVFMEGPNIQIFIFSCNEKEFVMELPHPDQMEHEPRVKHKFPCF